MQDNFFKDFKIIDSEDECETYGLFSVDSERNRKSLERSIEATIRMNLERGLDCVKVEMPPEISSYTLTERDLQNPYIYSIKDEPIISIKMKVHFCSM